MLRGDLHEVGASFRPYAETELPKKGKNLGLPPFQPQKQQNPRKRGVFRGLAMESGAGEGNRTLSGRMSARLCALQFDLGMIGNFSF